MFGKERRRVIVVTGASAGVGRAVARAFGEEKARLGLIARGVEGLEAAKREVEAAGGEALVLPLDVADSQAVDDAAEKIESRFGPIDVWINDAMVSVFSPVKEMTAQEFRRVTEVTYLGCVHGTLAALRGMLSRDEGIIIQVSSALAFRSIPLQSAYCAAKHAIAGFTESLRTELIHDHSKVQVMLVNLPALNTPQFGWSKSRMPMDPQPVPPIYQPEVAARAIVFGSKHPRRMIDVGHPTVIARAAEKLAPAVADRYLAATGYDAQQTPEPADPSRRNNLWEPIHEDRGAHGGFDAQARDSSAQLWLTTHRLLALGAALAAGMAFWLNRRNRPRC